ncbi:MAG: metalloregulator ArsR/SmtB family transcription factor [Devosia sp.]|nr:metalloregulator ArsR/SmtB family transcription factor [Devosia sp.]
METAQLGELEGKAGQIAGILRALGNDARLLLLCRLVRHGEVTAGSLIGTAGLSQSALSQHLARMREEGIVAYRREGQTLWYRIADPRIEELIGTLYNLYCGVDA